MTQAIRPDAADVSHITDLLLLDGQLFASTRHDGQIDSWTITGSGLTLNDSIAHKAALRVGDLGWLTPLDLGGGAALLSGGGTGGALMLRTPRADGTLPGGTTLGGTTGDYGTLQHTATVPLANGAHVVYGGMAGRDGLAQLTFNNAGSLTGKRFVSDNTRTYAADMAGVASATVDGTRYVYTASASEDGISTFAVATNGNLSAVKALGTADGLWVSDPTALASTSVGGNTFLVLAAAGTDSLTVMFARADGSLAIVDHLLDTRDTRFGGVTALDVVTYRDQTFIIAGGADDGITVLQLLPDGQMVTRATLADTGTMTLANVAAIAATGSGDGLDIFVASGSEDGITRLRYDIGPTGQTLAAPAGGGTLTGGAGADVFVMAFDGARDTITDFTLGEDRLDLSAFPMVRSKSQLTLAMTPTGFTVTYGDDVLIVKSADGGPIDHRLLTDADLLGGARIPQVIATGHAGPDLGTPRLPGATTSLAGISFRNHAAGSVNSRRWAGDQGSDTVRSTKGNDRLTGKGGRDMLAGGPGQDRIIGGKQKDVLNGNAGDDVIKGNAGNDKLDGDACNDLLYGGDGNDTLVGDDGDDRLKGDAGNDILYGGAGHDIAAGGDGNDTLSGDAGNDTLSSGDGSDRLFGGTGNDRLDG